jgi:transposase, IS30 family
MQAWHIPEGYDVGCLGQRRKLEGMCHYSHLSPQERDCIATLHAEGRSIGYIAGETGRDRSTICRELKRNGRHGRYGACAAQRRAEARHRRCRPKRRLSDPALAQKVRSLIMDRHWSPDEIDGRLRLENGGRCVVSLSTIYREVHAGTLDLPGAGPEGQVRRHLRRKGKRIRRKRPETRGKIRISHTVEERPAEADARSRLGDWEDGTVVGTGSACLLVLADRASRLLLAGRCRHDSASVSRAEVALLEGRPLETVTPDRGKEFAGHADVTKALGGVQFYFCDPHHPWQKPTVENTNGLLREFFPKGTDFGKVTDEEVQHAVDLINGRPRKVLKYRTANEVYREMLHSA